MPVKNALLRARALACPLSLALALLACGGAPSGAGRSSDTSVAVDVTVEGETRLVATNTLTCAHDPGGLVRCWMVPSRHGDLPASITPSPMSDAGALTVVAARGDWLCGLDQARALRCFESNLTGSLRPTSNEPRIRPEIEVPIDLVVGNGHGCVRDQAGQVGCFDDRFAGGFVYWVPPEGLTAVSLAAGTHHVCAIRPDRSVTCWGANTDLQLGAEPGSPVAGLSDVREVAPGALHTCAVRATGEVWCWGDDRWGQLGRGEPSSAPGPAPVPTITDARSIAAGHSHTCVVHADGTVSCWGRNLGGELGAGAGDEEHAPRRVPGLVGVRQLVAGFNHTCAVLTTGAVTCFGLSNTRSYRANLGTGAVTETTGN